MPSRPKVPDPSQGPLQSFAYDLRRAGLGKASIPFISDRSEPKVSRAALYAALSGTRLPSERTVAQLLMWWVGGPAVAEQYANEYEDPTWWWLDRLEQDHEARRWVKRYFGLAATLAEAAGLRARATAVSIDMPEEQRRLVQALAELAAEVGIEPSNWFWRGETLRQLEVYFEGKRIPSSQTLWDFVSLWAQRANVDSPLDTYQRLADLAAEARAARVRDRRAERSRLAAQARTENDRET